MCYHSRRWRQHLMDVAALLEAVNAQQKATVSPDGGDGVIGLRPVRPISP